jgi:hypothetical protein
MGTISFGEESRQIDCGFVVSGGEIMSRRQGVKGVKTIVYRKGKRSLPSNDHIGSLPTTLDGIIFARMAPSPNQNTDSVLFRAPGEKDNHDHDTTCPLPHSSYGRNGI